LETSKTIDGVKQPTLTTTMKPIEITISQSLISTTLMMYPEEFTNKEKSDKVQYEFEDDTQLKHFLAIFSGLSVWWKT
jgi:hypothetical protein